MLLLIVFSPLVLNSQTPTAVPIPTPLTGPWDHPSNIYQTVALFNCGIGTTTPAGKLEVKYKPCLNSQIGLIVTSLGCTMNELNNVPLTWNNYNSTYQVVNLGGPAPPTTPVTLSPVFTFTTFNWNLVKPNEKPLFWIREEDIDNSSIPVNYTTRFIVNPNGSTGINTNSPRGTLDVIQAYKGKKDEPTAIFGKILVGTQIDLMNYENPTNPVPSGVKGDMSCEVMIFNNMRAKNRNRIAQENDQGIIFSDGGNSDGSNLNSGLIIAPWSGDYLNPSSTVGGIRIDKMGKVEVHGGLRATELNLDAKWWSDFVFNKNYNLMRLDSVKSFILRNGHLPNMPSEREILDSGINVSNMQALQQQKIEELTLYTISQEQEITELKAKLEEQTKRQNEIEAKLNLLLK